MPKSDIPVETLIQQLHGADWTARCDAARLLGQSRDPRAVDALLPDLHDADWRVRRNAAQALGALRDQRATEPLLALLHDRTLTVRQRTIVALGRIKDIHALPALLDILLAGRRESYEATKAIRKFGKKALPEIVKAYEASNHQNLLLLLVELKYVGAFDFLIKSLEKNDHASRQLAIVELGKLGDQRAIPYLMAQLNEDDPILLSEVINALGKLGAAESIPTLLGLLIDDELYGPRSGVYHAVANAMQLFGGVAGEVQKAFPGKYPTMFQMAGASFSLPEAMGLMGQDPSNILNEALARFQTGSDQPKNLPESVTDAVQQAAEDMAWKFGVMFADAKDAKQERVTRLIELLRSPSHLQRAGAALTLPWYGEERSLEPLKQLLQDPDEIVRRSVTWAVNALQKTISYRNQFGM